MTDRSSDLDRAERIRRLQDRRAGSARSRSTTRSTSTAQTADAPGSVSTRKRSRRRHPAAGTRWALAGLSVASFCTIAGTVAVADGSGVAGAQPAQSVSSVGTATATVTGTQSTAASASSATPRATAKSTSTPAAHTTTKGS